MQFSDMKISVGDCYTAILRYCTSLSADIRNYVKYLFYNFCSAFSGLLGLYIVKIVFLLCLSLLREQTVLRVVKVYMP